MHSTLVRAQNVFGYFTTVVFAVSALIATSVLLLPQRPSASVAVRNVQVYVFHWCFYQRCVGSGCYITCLLKVHVTARSLEVA